MVRKIDSASKKAGASKSQWIDISIPFRNNMLHWPGDPFLPEVKRIWEVDKGDKVTMSEFHFISHTGTHIDAPLHFVPHGGTIDLMPLDTAIGPARVIEIKDTESVKPKELIPYKIQKGERILFKTQNSSKLFKTDEFSYQYTYLSFEAAEYLVGRGIALVGFDYISICKYETEAEYPSVAEYLAKSAMHRTHRIFLENGIYIMEFVNLSGVKPGKYELICLPIRLERGDAGLTRAVLRPL
jgi:arylformamidase